MTWTSYRNRGETLRRVTAAVDERRDGRLPMDLAGVREAFGDELQLLGALQLRWHTRLAGRIERELMHQPMDLESAVVAAWRATADELPGIRAVVDHHRDHPLDAAMAEALAKATAKERILLAVMAGQGSARDAAAVPAGARIEERARSGWRPAAPVVPSPRTGLLDRLRAALVA